MTNSSGGSSGYDSDDDAAWREDFEKHILGNTTPNSSNSSSDGSQGEERGMLEQYGLSKGQYIGNVFDRALSLRLIFSCLLLSLICSMFLGTDGVGGVLSFTIGGVVWAAYALYPGSPPSRCPYCRKRVKLAAEACHHCGRMVVQQPE